MGYKYVQHSDMCGCERCAAEWEHENPQPIFDRVKDQDYRDDGTHLGEPPLDYDDYYYEDDFDD